MKIQLKYIAFLILMLLIKNTSFGESNLMAGEITWNCVGKDSFMVELRLIRDCNAPALQDEVLKFYCGTTTELLGSLTLTKPVPVDITPVCCHSCTRCSDSSCPFLYGFQEYRYIKLFVIPTTSCCEIQIRFQSCCRADLAANISSGMSMFLESGLNRCLASPDNSPEFKSSLVQVLCIGQNEIFTQDATTPNDDSLKYEWAGLLSAPNTHIPFINGYDSNKALYFWGFPNENLIFPRGMYLDPLSGDIYFRPMKIESSAMALKVSKYRKGIKTGDINRNLLFIVINCPNNHQPSLGPAIYYKQVLAKSTVTFTITTNDLDPGDSLTIFWNKSIPGASWTDNNGTTKHPTGNFNWTPQESDARSNPYTFTVSVKDDAFPKNNNTYCHTYQILVVAIPRAIITVTDSGNGNFWFYARCIEGAGPIFSWTGGTFNFDPAAGPLTFHHFDKAGKYPYQMTVTTATGGCRVYRDTIVVKDYTSISPEQGNFYFLYPVPAKDYVIFRLKTGFISSMKLLNYSGKVIFSGEEIKSDEIRIPRPADGKGIYLLHIIASDNRIYDTKLFFE